MSEIDRIPVNQLPERYDLARSALYKRLEALNIKPERIGNKAYVNADQLRMLDDLHVFVQQGGTNAEFRERHGLGKADDDDLELSTGLSTVQPGLVQLITTIASEVAARFQSQTTSTDPFEYLKVLEQAHQNGWLLRTSELAYLLDLSPTLIQQYGESFSEAGFVFTRAGYRSGGEIAWQVSKRLK
jgi:hypothetical protein